MIAFRRDAKRWARYVGAPADIVARADRYEEHRYNGEENNQRMAAKIYDATGRRIWRREVRAGKTATRRIAIRCGWVDKRGRDLLHGEVP